MLSNNVWQTEQLRFTFFFAPEHHGLWSDFWTKITASEAEHRNENRLAGQIVEQGTWDDKQLVTTHFRDRLDVVIQDGNRAFNLPDIGAFVETADLFAARVIAAITAPLYATVTRIAFGGVLLQATESKEASYRALSQYLPHVELDETSKDFLYQINRPVFSEVNSAIGINRITKWNGIVGKLIEVDEQGTGVVISQHAYRLEFDVNSAAETAFSGENVASPESLSELLALAKKIAANGDL